MRGHYLQRTEERVGRSIAAREEYAHPAEQRAEEREGHAGCGEGESERRRGAGVIQQEGQSQDGGECELSERELPGCLPDDAEEAHGREPDDERRQDGGKEAGCSGSGEPTEVEDGGVGSGLVDDGWNPLDGVVKPRPLDELVGAFKVRLNLRVSPGKDEDDEQRVGRPGADYFASGVLVRR